MYIAVDDDVFISCHRTREGALKSLLEYRGFTKEQIKEAMRQGEDITMLDPFTRIIETLR